MSHGYCSLLMVLLCVLLQADRRTKMSWETQTRQKCVFNWELVHYSNNWSVLTLQHSTQLRSKCDHNYTDQTSTSGLWRYSLPLYFKCLRLITLPTGISALVWEYCVSACCWHFDWLDVGALFQTSSTSPLLVSGLGVNTQLKQLTEDLWTSQGCGSTF